MTTWRDGPELRAKHYAKRYDRKILKELGFGYDGIVFSTACQSAIKALQYENACSEANSYDAEEEFA